MDAINLIGRKREQGQLTEIVNSGRPEFAVVYGRRRVGKTFLINRYFKERFAFKYTGVAKKGLKVQLGRFGDELRRQGLPDIPTPQTVVLSKRCVVLKGTHRPIVVESVA